MTTHKHTVDYQPLTMRELFRLGAAYMGLLYMPKVLGELVGAQSRYGHRRRVRNPFSFGTFREVLFLTDAQDIQVLLKQDDVDRPDCVRHSFRMTSEQDNAFTVQGSERKTQLSDFYKSMNFRTGVEDEEKLRAFIQKEVSGWPRSINDLGDLLTTLTSRTLCHTFFDYNMPPDEARAMNTAYSGGLQNNVLFGTLIRAFTTKGSDSLPLLNTPRAVKVFRSITDKIIGNALATGKDHFPDNFLHKLMTSTGFWENPNDTNAHEKVAAQLTILLAGGHEAPRSMMFWALNHIARDEAVQDKLVAEVRESSSSEAATPFMKKQPFAVSVLLESMRLFPPAFVLFKTSANDVALSDGEVIKSNTLIMLPTWVVHRDPRYYQTPQKFNPAHMSYEQVKDRPREAYMTYGSGSHACPGQGFAGQFGAIVLGAVLEKYKLVAPSPDMPKPTSKAVIGSPRGCKLELHDHVERGGVSSPVLPLGHTPQAKCPFARLVRATNE